MRKRNCAVRSGTKGRWRSIVRSAALVVFSVAVTTPVAAQPTKATQKAAELGQAGDWHRAVEVLEAAVDKKDADHGGSWYQLSQAYERLERWDEVISAATTALEKGFPRVGLGRLALARAYMGKGQSEQALGQLDQLAAAGSNQFLLRALRGSSSLSPLAGEPRFAAVVKALTPCTGEKYRQFDFWLGDYRVENPGGTTVGENEITLHLGGCLLMESWTGGSGSTGMSMNYYDPNDDSWNQIYLDNSGNPGNWPPLKGRLERDGSMVLWSPEGESRSRWTWKEVAKGKVRQMAEQTNDGGKTWQATWDSYYFLKPSL